MVFVDTMAKLKIAMLTTFYPPYHFGGDAIGCQRLVNSLAAKGYEITVVHDIDGFTTLSKTSPQPVRPPDNVSVVGLKSRYGSVTNLLTHQLGRPVIHNKQLQSILKPGAFDIIWFHNVSLVGGPGLLSYGDGLKIYEAHEHWLVCPTHVLWRHNRELCDKRQCNRCAFHYRRPPQLWRYLPFFNRQLDKVDTFIAKSEFSRNKHKEFGFPKTMQVVPYFLPGKANIRTETSHSPHNRPYFLFVGRLEKIKGLDDTIPVFADYPEADLLILGTGDYETELRSQAKDVPNVKFLGRLAPEQLANYYNSAIALIVPSVCFETFGIIIIESLQQGTPVIARKIGPFEEIINLSKAGLLYTNAAELKDAMLKMQSNPSFRNSLAQSATKSFNDYWCEQAVMKKYFTALHEAALAKGNKKVATVLEQEI